MPTHKDGFTSSVVLLHPNPLSVNTLVDITRSLPDWFPKQHYTFNKKNLHEPASPSPFLFLRL